MTKAEEALWLADKLKQAGLVTDTLRTVIEAALAEAREEGKALGAMEQVYYNPAPDAQALAEARAAERERIATECLKRRGHFASDFAAEAFADIVRRGYTSEPSSQKPENLR